MKQRRILSSKLLLVPYQLFHVPKYNQWMQNKELQYLTGSEPLNLEDEYEVHESWITDPAKCTFIVLDRSLYEKSTESEEQRQINSMIGDVNFYIQEDCVAEIEVMIAESEARNRGYGKEAVTVMMKFGHQIVGVKKFEAKIKMNNFKSQNLFCKLGFIECSRSKVFEEITYEANLTVNASPLIRLFGETEILYTEV